MNFFLKKYASSLLNGILPGTNYRVMIRFIIQPRGTLIVKIHVGQNDLLTFRTYLLVVCSKTTQAVQSEEFGFGTLRSNLGRYKLAHFFNNAFSIVEVQWRNPWVVNTVCSPPPIPTHLISVSGVWDVTIKLPPTSAIPRHFCKPRGWQMYIRFEACHRRNGIGTFKVIGFSDPRSSNCQTESLFS